MKKSFHISLIFLFILFMSTMIGFSNNRKSTSPVDSSKDQMSLKASGSALQHTSLLVESVAENDFDADKTFFDLPFTFFVKYILFWGSDANSSAMITSAAEFVHHYHLPKYLLFHNLKIRV